MNIEQAIDILKNSIADYVIGEYCEKCADNKICDDRNEDCYYQQAIDTVITAYEKEKEKNKRAEELYMQHNQMIIDILKECDYMIKNRYYMNDVAIRQHTENIKNIAKYYIKEPEWIKIKEEQDNVK